MKVSVTDKALREIMPRMAVDAAVLLTALIVPAAEAELSSPERMAAFLAQVAHESGEFRWMEEHWGPIPAQLRYEPPGAKSEALGNVAAGDGYRYRGRGPMMLTGRANYRAAGKALVLPLEQQPELAARLDVGLRVAAWFWRTRKLNEPADRRDIREVTKRINGGYTGLADRKRYYERALRALDAGQPSKT